MAGSGCPQEGFWDGAWAAGVGIFFGSLCGFVAQILLSRLGQGCGPWAAILCLMTSAMAGSIYRGRKLPWDFFGSPGLLLICVFIAGQLRDSSWDGLEKFSSLIQVTGQENAWMGAGEGVSDPISDLSQLGNRTNIFFGLIFAAPAGNLEYAKWPTLAWSLAGALMLASTAGQLGLAIRWRWLILFFCLGQPAVLSQTPTLYQDGAMAGALAGVFASFLRCLPKLSRKSLGAFFVTLCAFSFSKRVGLILGAILLVLLVLGLVSRTNSRFPIVLLTGFGIFSLMTPLLMPAIRYFGLTNDNNPLGKAVYRSLLLIDPRAIDSSGKDGIHGGCGEVSSSAVVMFARRHFAASKRADNHPSIKPPFWFTRPELDVFSDLTPDLRFGGYGPLYGTAVLLALIPGLMLLLSTSPPQAGWKWILVACLVMIPITPSWWARWFPQGWWIPFAACVGFLCGPGEWQKKFRWGTWLSRLGLVALGLNSVLILVFTVKGYGEAESIIRKQLTFVKSLSQPVAVHWERFGGARFWLDRENIQWRKEPLPLHPPTLRLYRTELDVALAKEDLILLQKDHSDLANTLLKKNLLQKP